MQTENHGEGTSDTGRPASGPEDQGGLEAETIPQRGECPSAQGGVLSAPQGGGGGAGRNEGSPVVRERTLGRQRSRRRGGSCYLPDDPPLEGQRQQVQQSRQGRAGESLSLKETSTADQDTTSAERHEMGRVRKVDAVDLSQTVAKLLLMLGAWAFIAVSWWERWYHRAIT